MSTPSDLTEIAASLRDWRANKKTKYERIPDELLRRARGLRGGSFSDNKICTVTGLSLKQLAPKNKTQKSTMEFVELPPVHMQEPVVVEIHDGTRSVILRFCPSINIEKLLSQFYR